MSTTANVTTNANNNNQSCESVVGVEQHMIGNQTVQQYIKCSSINKCLKCVATANTKNSVKRRFPMHSLHTHEPFKQMQHKSMPIPVPVTVVSKNCLLFILVIVVQVTYRFTSNLQHEVAASKILNVNLEENLQVMSTDIQTLTDSVRGLTASVSILGLENQALANKNKNLVSQNKIEVKEHNILKQHHHELQESYHIVEGEKFELLVKNDLLQFYFEKTSSEYDQMIYTTVQQNPFVSGNTGGYCSEWSCKDNVVLNTPPVSPEKLIVLVANSTTSTAPSTTTREKAANEKAAKEVHVKEKVVQEKAVKEKAVKEKVAKEKVAKEKVAKENVAKEKAYNTVSFTANLNSNMFNLHIWQLFVLFFCFGYFLLLMSIILKICS